MVQLIVGVKGKGKTKILLDKVNAQIKNVDGSIIYLDKSTKHMYELNNKVRLIDLSEYLIGDAPGFIGFILGLISQDRDIEEMYLDSFLKIAAVDADNLSATLHKLNEIGNKFKIKFTLSMSMDEVDLPEDVKTYVAVAL
ncbi:MAG: twitching motility protein PilT [Lachnospiraceae bacterium]